MCENYIVVYSWFFVENENENIFYGYYNFRCTTCDDSGVVCIAFSPTSDIIIVGTSDGHIHCFTTRPFCESTYCLLENAHDLGVSSVDFAAVSHMLNIGKNNFLFKH